MATSVNSQDFSLTGLRVLVTGGGSGIGKAIADAMTQAGARVVVCDVNNTTKPNYVCDVSNSRDVATMFAAIERDLGGLDILVNNVGVPGPTARVDEMDADAYDECVRVNLGGTFRCTKAAVPMLLKTRGSIINISTSAGIFGYPLRSPYVAAKWGIIGLTKSWAMELGADAVLVNTAIAIASDANRMAHAFKQAVEAGRTAFEIGLGSQQTTASATSPLTAFLN